MKRLPKKWIFSLIFLLGLLGAVFFGWKSVLAVPHADLGGGSDLLARVIQAEGGAEPFTGQVAIGAVILNRIQNPRFPKSISGVIYQPHAFESVSNGQINRPANEACRKAARSALSGWDPSGGALFFFNPSKVGSRSYVWTRQIIQKIGKHVFAQ